MWVQIGLLCFSLFCSFALNAVIQSMLSTHGSFWCHWEWMSLLDVCRCSTWAEANMETPSTCILSIRHQGAIVVVPNTEEHFPLYAYAHWLHTFTWTIETSLQFNHTMNENFEMGRGLRHASVIFTGDRLVNNAGAKFIHLMADVRKVFAWLKIHSSVKWAVTGLDRKKKRCNCSVITSFKKQKTLGHTLLTTN